MRPFFVGCVAVVASVLVVLALAFAFAIVRLPLMNVDRIVTQHSLQYVQAHQDMMVKAYADWERSTDAPHKAAARDEVCAQAVLLDRADWPSTASQFAASTCR